METLESILAEPLEETLRALKAVAEPTRLRLLVLCHRGESSVSELVRVLGQSQPRISRHLKLLCDAGLLERFRDGHWIYYRTPSSGHAGARVLKLLGRRASRAVGVDIDGDQRRQARAELAVAGLGNCTIRAGDAHRLDFADDAFDTVILDEVLGHSSTPEQAVAEAARVLAPGGRLLLIEPLVGRSAEEKAGAAAAEARARWIAGLAGEAGLALGRPRPVPARQPAWLVSVATPAQRQAA